MYYMCMRILSVLLPVLFLVSSLHASEGKGEDHPVPSPEIHVNDAWVTAFAEVRNLLHARAGGSATDWSGRQGSISALLAYLDDHMRAEYRGEGWRYRKNILLYYQSYVGAGADFPFENCETPRDIISRTVCIGKGTMLLHMVRGLTGDQVFAAALKKLTEEKDHSLISWDDMRESFETASGKDLAWFFDQWTVRKGVPEFVIEDQDVSIVNGVRTVSFDIVQQDDVYRVLLPVTVKTEKGDVVQIMRIEKSREHCEIPVPGVVREIILDRNYDVMRRLSPDETTPRIAGLLSADEKLLVLPEETGDAYSNLVGELKDGGYGVRQDAEMTDEDIRTHSLFIIGYEGRVVKRLFGTLGAPGAGFTLTVRRNPLNASKVIAVAYADMKDDIPSPDVLASLAEYSRIRFRGNQNTEKSIEESDRGIVVKVSKPILAIPTAHMIRLEDHLDSILKKTLIYVGERHMNFEDHKAQMEVIMNLHERGHTFAIGMEMFQRPFQKEIDDYLAGALNEREFLKRTQYFKRWKFDYHLYREIIEYAKAKKIPIVALNLWTEIVKKVSADGLDSLSDIERAELPDSMDMSDEAYRKRLKEVFEQHRGRESKSFENFYQAQILWDETMAHTIDRYLAKHPDHQMIVLAGAGHLMYGSGIPKRAHRLNKRDYVIILPGTEFADRDVGDYLSVSESLPLPSTLKLGVVLREGGGSVEIEKVIPGSVAKSAGLRKGDILVSLDDWPIEDIDDINIFMVGKKRGEQLVIKALRKRFLFGYREVILQVTI